MGPVRARSAVLLATEELPPEPGLREWRQVHLGSRRQAVSVTHGEDTGALVCRDPDDAHFDELGFADLAHVVEPAGGYLGEESDGEAAV
jgi:hypothetical protein